MRAAPFGIYVVALEILLPPDPQAPGRARRFARDVLAGRSEDLIDLVELLVSEVVTNAVLHARSEIHLALTWRGDAFRVEVADHSPLLPAQRHFSELATTGRGIQLVEEIADSWGMVPSNGGKVVWFELTAVERP